MLQQGCVAPYSVVITDNAVYWLSQDRHGRNMLMRGEGYSAKRVSNFAVEQADPQVALDGLDAAAEGRLTQVGGFGGAGEVQSVGKDDHVVQAAQIHGVALYALNQ